MDDIRPDYAVTREQLARMRARAAEVQDRRWMPFRDDVLGRRGGVDHPDTALHHDDAVIAVGRLPSGPDTVHELLAGWEEAIKVRTFALHCDDDRKRGLV